MIIINQTPIEELNQLYLYIPGGLLICLVLILGVIAIWKAFKGKPALRFSNIYLTISGIGLVIFVTWGMFASIFLKTPCGRYRYEMTFDTTESVNEAFDTYNFIEYKDGVYIFEDKQK